MWFIRAIRRLFCGGASVQNDDHQREQDHSLHRYNTHEPPRRVRQMNMIGLRSGSLIFSEKGD
ncbi:MAG: hypothetical protein IJE07_11680 [Clostridia bacterium]|nr:hypothetical protein [Clostridia bacterium]